MYWRRFSRVTLKDIVDLIQYEPTENQRGKLWLYLGEFLDYFYWETRPKEERERLLRDEPVHYEEVDKITYLFLASTAHYLSHLYDLEIPDWCMETKYVLDKPYFSMNAKGNLRLILLVESPIHFKMRNMFISANSLTRV